MFEVQSGILGYPRIGGRRELKWALERYWSGQGDERDLLRRAAQIRRENWQEQQRAGATWVAVGDFSLFDHVLDLALQLGIVPARFGGEAAARDLSTYFLMAHGRARADGQGGAEEQPLERANWFDTRYHYLVPELEAGATFSYQRGALVEQVVEARALGFVPRPVLVGPVTLLLLAKDGERRPAPLARLPELLPAYAELLADLRSHGVRSVQVDEPCLSGELPDGAADALVLAYNELSKSQLSLELTTYFGPLRENLEIALELPVRSLHLDALAAPEEARRAARRLRPEQALSLGLIDGRNVWRADLEARLALAEELLVELGPSRLMLASTCSLMHVPVDTQNERSLDAEIGPWLSFARQKLGELSVLSRGLCRGRAAVAPALAVSRALREARSASVRLHSPAVRERLRTLSEADFHRSLPAAERRVRQRLALRLPPLPTTTIGSLPQLPELRELRVRHESGEIPGADYERQLRAIVDATLQRQEELGLDVLVHGQPERNDRVEYFGELLEGMLVSAEGWVQSYGSCCVKPLVLFGDVERKQPMTVRWASYAQSRSTRPVKGTLTGPITMLKGSFVRDDEAPEHSCRALALALRDELLDLERAGIGVIQLDEPDFHEALPLRKSERAHDLGWSAKCVMLATSGVRAETQIHLHLGLSGFEEPVEGMGELDADVISLEPARSPLQAAEAFARSGHDSELSLGIWDSHSSRVPPASEMLDLLGRALSGLDADRVWVNPDCGLETRSWDEVRPALANMVQAVHVARQRLERAAR